MTFLTCIPLAVSIARPLNWLARALARHAIDAALAWHRHREMRRTQRALGALDDRMLHDLGLGTSDVPSVSAELAGLAPHTRRHPIAIDRPRHAIGVCEEA